MIVFIDRDLNVGLKEERDFARFHLEIAGSSNAIARIRDQVASLVSFVDEDDAWISVAGVRAMGPGDRNDEWNDSFERMIDAVRPHGWVRDEPEPEIKAHVVWVHGTAQTTEDQREPGSETGGRGT